MRTHLLSVAALAIALSTSPCRAQSIAMPPHPGTFVRDDAGLLTEDELRAIEDLTRAVESRDGVRLAVLTLGDAQGADPKAIAVSTLNAWNVGRKSVLLLLCMKPRELFIQPGTDLASMFGERTSTMICRNTIAPKMRAGDRAGAIRAGLDAIAALVEASPGSAPGPEAPAGSPPSPLPAVAPPSQPSGFSRAMSGAFKLFAGLLPILGFLGAGGAIVWIALALRRKCPRCGKPMSSSSREVCAPSYTSTGQGETTYTCTDCRFSQVVPYTISMLSESSSTWDSSSSSYDSSSSSYDSSSSSSYDSGSSSSSDSGSSSSSDSSSSSSDGSGGGGSSW